jgi:soluble lytic murein transglycosylase-like protein
MVSALMPVLASAILISSPLTPLSQQTTPNTSSSIPFTRVIPVNNFVAYTVESGDTLKTIAIKYYADENYWTTIWNDNIWIADPDNLTEGFMLKIQINKPEKIADLNADLKEKLSKLHPQPVFDIYNNQTVYLTTPTYAPQSNYDDTYKTAGEKYGIPWQILYGIHMTETGCRNGAIMNGIGSGAQGPMQFMPGTWRAYGVDGDGDGIADINNAIDAINGAANYLAKHGSLDNGLRSYGGNYSGTLAYARAKGYNL